MNSQNIRHRQISSKRSRLDSLLYAALVSPAILFAVLGEKAAAGQLTIGAFQAYNSANAASIVPGTFSLYSTSVASVRATQINEGLAEVGKKTAGFDLLAPSQLQANLLTAIEPVIIGPGGQLYLTDGHHTFTALIDSIYGASNPTVYVNVIANYSNLTAAQFFAMLQANNELLPLNNGIPQTVNLNTGAPIPTSLTALTNDPYRGLEYSILKNKSAALFTTTSNLTGAVGASSPGLDKMTGFYSDFLEAAAYRSANGGNGLPYLSPGDIALATQWNLNGANKTGLPNVAGSVSVAQLPGFILNQNIVNSGGISNTTLASGALDGNGTFTGITTINAGTPASPITIGTPNTGFIMQLGADKGDTVTLNGVNTYTGGTSLLAGTLIVASDSSLGAAPTGAAIDPNNVKTSVQAANGIVFNSLTEGNATLQIGTTPGGGTATFNSSRPIAISGEIATINLNGYLTTLTGPLASFGSGGAGLGNATGVSDLTIDDNAASNGKLILSTASPNFYGNLIIGSANAPTVEVMNDAALGATTGTAATLGQVNLNGGTLQAGASFAAPERNMFLGSGSNIDVNGFSTSWGTLTNVQRTLDILNSNTTTAGSIGFNNLVISAAASLQLAGGAAGETVTFANGVSRMGNDTLVLNPSTSTSLGTTEKVMSGTAASSLVNGMAPAWIVTNNGVTKSAGPYDFVTYGANGYVATLYTLTNALGAGTASQVVKLNGIATLTGNATVYALNTAGKITNVGAGNTLTVGDGINPAGLILATGSQVNGGTLAFGGSEGVIWLSGANPTISSKITGSNGLTFSGSGAVNISTAANVSGALTIDSGTVTLSGLNVFATNSSGFLLDNTKTKPAAAGLAITANNTLAALNSIGNNSTVAISNSAALTLGDTVNNLGSTLSATITQTGAPVAGALTFNGSGLFDLSGGKITLASGSTAIVNNSAQLRVTASEVAKSNFGIALNGTSQLQLAQNGGSVLTNTISGTGALHLIGGTVQITGTSNTYSGGTIVETGSILDITTANLPAINPNIANSGGLVVFDQATSGTYAGIISDAAEMGAGPVLSGAFDKDDSSGANGGNVTLAQKQTYSGQTTVEAGTLTLAAVDTVATSSGVDLGRVGGCVGACSASSPAATLALSANNTIQALTSEVGNTTAVALGANTLTINSASGANAAFAGSITGVGALVKSGAGAQILSGASTYSGGTTVQAGSLVLTGNINSAGATTVNGGTLAILNGGALTTSSTTVNGGVLMLDNNGSTLSSASIAVGENGSVIASANSLIGVTSYNNGGLLNLQNGSANNTLSLGAYNGGPGSQLQIGVNFSTGSADKLMLTSVTGSSQIVLTNVSPNTPVAYNPNGIPVIVSANPMNPNSFTLAGGPIQKGLFQYDLAYQADPAFVLIGAPTADAFRFATLPTAVQSIWYDTASLLIDRQADLRDLTRSGGASAQTGVTPSVWARALGEWGSRTETQSYTTLNKTYAFQTGYNQNTSGVFGGIDGGARGLISHDDALLLGASAGYINSNQAFKGSTTSAKFEGGSVGLTATYLNQNVFADAILKADVLNLNFSAPSAAGFGAAQGSSAVTSFGAMFDTCYRFNAGRASFVEPLATLAWVSSRVGGLALAGSQVSFGNNATLRGRVGLRAGSTLLENADLKVEAIATASYWNRFSGGASAAINSGVGAPVLNMNDAQLTSYGEFGLGLNLFSQKSGWSGFLKGDYQLASGYNAGSVKGGVRYDF